MASPAHRGRPRDHDRGALREPLTFQAIIIWQEELNDGKVLLRDIIDLDATYAGPDAKALADAEARPRRPRASPPRANPGGSRRCRRRTLCP